MWPKISLTGATLRDVPMTKRRSTCSRSASRALSKLEESFSPKNVMSGLRMPKPGKFVSSSASSSSSESSESLLDAKFCHCQVYVSSSPAYSSSLAQLLAELCALRTADSSAPFFQRSHQQSLHLYKHIRRPDRYNLHSQNCHGTVTPFRSPLPVPACQCFDCNSAAICPSPR